MVDAGAFQRRQIAADLNAKLDDDGKLQARFVGLLLDSETQFDYGNAHAAKNDRVYLAPSLTWRPSAATSLTLLSEYTSDRRQRALDCRTAQWQPDAHHDRRSRLRQTDQ